MPDTLAHGPERARHARDPIPARAGIGLRSPHVDELIRRPHTAASWLEIHAENYFSAGGPRLAALETLRRDHPLSVHGVGLSLGSAGGIDGEHLARLKALVDRFEPGLVSEHVAWSVNGDTYLNDLLPLPYTEEALAVLCRNVQRMQDTLGRPVLMENPSLYLRFAQSVIPEGEFLAELSRRTGCGLLIDVNNLHVGAVNVGTEAASWFSAIPTGAVGEIHIAGHFTEEVDGRPLLIDDHGSPVAPAVWDLLATALDHLGPMPVLVEWDNRIPPLDVLLGEAATAQTYIDRSIPARAGLGHAA